MNTCTSEFYRNKDNNDICYLYPSALFASTLPTIVSTVLGTCVAVCLYDPDLKIGGINHYMLPLWNGQGQASSKYGNIAIKNLIDKMISLGCKKSNLQAKLFGGKSEGQGNVSQFRIGERNTETAILILQREGIPVISSSLNGKFGRKLQYNTSTGEVLMNYLHTNQVL